MAAAVSSSGVELSTRASETSQLTTARDLPPAADPEYAEALLRKAHPEHGGNLVVHQTKGGIFKREGYKSMAGCIRGPYIALYPSGSSKRATAFIPLREDSRATLVLGERQGRKHGFTVRTGSVTYELFAANANAQRRWVIVLQGVIEVLAGDYSIPHPPKPVVGLAVTRRTHNAVYLVWDEPHVQRLVDEITGFVVRLFTAPHQPR